MFAERGQAELHGLQGHVISDRGAAVTSRRVWDDLRGSTEGAQDVFARLSLFCGDVES